MCIYEGVSSCMYLRYSINKIIYLFIKRETHISKLCLVTSSYTYILLGNNVNRILFVKIWIIITNEKLN